MTYNKPPQISYTDMAIWIDTNCYKDDCDDAKLYEYLYHLLYMISYKHQYFKSMDYYDDYALQGASKLFMRLKDPRQFEDNSKLPKINSILNYIKTVSYPYKVDFEQKTYLETSQDTFIIHSDIGTLSEYIAEESDIFDRIDFDASIECIPNIIKNYLYKIPHLRNNLDIKNIYITCLLNILDSISFTKDEFEKLTSNKSDINMSIDQIFKASKNRSPILYHLPSYMSNYIKVIIKEINHAIATELSFDTKSYISSETSIKNLLAANLEDT